SPSRRGENRMALADPHARRQARPGKDHRLRARRRQRQRGGGVKVGQAVPAVHDNWFPIGMHSMPYNTDMNSFVRNSIHVCAIFVLAIAARAADKPASPE